MNMFAELNGGVAFAGNVIGGYDGADAVPEGASGLFASAWRDSGEDWFSREERNLRVREELKRERLKAAEVLHHVWLYDDDADSRAAVDGSDKYSFYGSGRTRCTDELLPVYGRDYAEAVMPGHADDPWACVEAQLEGMADEGRKAQYKREFEGLKVKGGDTADDYYGLLGRMVRDDVRAKYAAFKAKEAEVQGSLDKMDRYVAGEELMDAVADGAADGLTEEDLDNVRSVVDPKLMADAEAVRAFMRTYVKPLQGKDDAEEILRTLSQLEDELFECIGEDEQRAGMVYEALMDFAEGVKASNKVGVDDEFVVAVGKKLQDWGRVLEMYEEEHAVAAAYMHQDFISDAYIDAMEAAQEATRRKYEQYKKYENARASLRAAINKSLEVGDGESWWKGSLRTATMMAGDTLPYLVPGVGYALGTADVAVRGLTEGTDMYRLQGLTGEQAGGQAAVDTIVQAGVEWFPFSRVGGKGLSAFVRSRFGKGLAKGKVGALSRWAVRQTQKSTARALAAEWGAAVIDEAVLEPIVGGFMQYGAEHLFDVLNFEHGQTKEFAACFEELRQVWEPRQLAGLAIFTAGLTGVSTPAIRQNVKYFAAKRVMWEAEGLKPGQVDELMAIKDVGERVEVGRKMVDDGWVVDAEGMAKRMSEANAKIKERGEVLVMTGEGALDPEVENSELAPAYRAVWADYVEKGLLPKVEAQKDGQFKVTHNGKEYVMSAAHADAYLEHAIEEAEGVMLKEARTAAEKAKGVNLREEIGLAVSRIAGGAALRAVAKGSEKSGIEVQDLVAGLPEFIAKPILAKGQVMLADAKAISEWALGQIRALVEGGASEFDARMTRPEADGMARSLGEWSTYADDFAHRETMAGLKPGEGAVSVYRSRGEKAVRFNGREVMGQVIMGLKGHVSHYGAVEDIAESVTDMMLQERAAVLVEQGEAGSMAEGVRMALDELADVVSRARAVVMKADPKAKIEEVKKGDYMSVIEALSTMARAKFLSSGVVPKWMQALTSGLKGIVGTGMAVEKVRAAYAEVLRKEPNALAELEGMLADMGVYVQDAMREARIEAVDIQAWKAASAIAGARAAGPLGVGGAAVSDAVQEAERVEEEIVRAEGRQEVLPVKSASEVAAEAKERLDEMVPGSNAPAEMQGVFVDDKCYYNEAGGFWCGMIAKEKLSDGTEQVKVGAKGKHGVIAGRELTGKFQQNVGAIYIWKRRDGSLQVISGRHRFAKLMDDAGARYCNCYVFEEDAEHDEKWARMLDYENNMRDDQADEVTAATYVRETGLPDEVLKERGLMRNDSRSKRGIFIGRHARQELWTRFVNGAVKPKDAQTICELTRSVKAEDRIDEIQGKCCMLLDTGKSWEYIGGMVQLMASKDAQMKQGLLDFGADFMEDLARAAEWIEKCVHKVDAAIKMLRNGRKMSGEMREEALRLGVQTETDADSEEVLRDLQLLRKKFELIGSYPDLVAQAQMWDGKSDVDPVGYYLENARKERIEAQLEGEMTADEYLAEQARKAAAESVPALFTMEMYKARTGSEKFAPDARGKEPVLSVNVHAVLADGSKATKNDLIADEDGSVFWGRLPELEALKDKGYAALDIIMRLGGKSDGFKHIVHKHGQWIMDAMGIDDPVKACKIFIAEVLGEVKKIQYQQNKGKDALLLKQGEAQRYFIVVIGKDRVEPNFAAIRTAFVASEPGRFDSEISLYEGEEALELRIPMSSFGENQRFRGASERQDRSSDYPDTAASSPSEDIMPQVGRVVKHEELISYKNNSFSANMEIAKEMADIKAAAVADGSFMKAPNGKPSNLNERQWLQVRTAAFKRWFGDWERAAELTFVSNGYDFKKGRAELDSKESVLFNEVLDLRVELNRTQKDKAFSPNARRKSIDNGFSVEQHCAVAAHLPTAFKHAMLLGEYNDAEEDANIAKIMRLGTPVIVDGQKALAFMTVKVSYQKKKEMEKPAKKVEVPRLYSLELEEIVRLGGQLKRLEHLQQNASSPSSEKIVSDFNAKVKEYFENVSKIVDENGEPRVMYHGSPTAGIREFEMHKALYGEGAFFTSSPEEALSYTGLDEDEFEDWEEFDAVKVEIAENNEAGAGDSTFSANMEIAKEMADIKAAAVADGSFMKAPNGKPSNLNERQWLQVRTAAFKRWFGDWEKVARFNSAVQQLLSMSEVASITGTEFAPDGRKLTDKVTEFWNKEYGGVAKNPVLGDVVLDTRSVKASIAHGVGRLKSAAFAVVHDVIERGVLVEIAPDWKGRGEDSYVIAAPVQIGNTAYVCEVVVMKGETRTGFYLHEVQIKEKLLDVFKTGVVTGTSGASKSILLDVWQRVKQIEENCSKVVDENGEPMVMYHGSPTAGIREFEMHEALYGEGAFFTSSPEEALSYTGLDEDEFEDWDEFDAAATDSGLMYEVFLNIRDEERFYERNGGTMHARAVAANEIKSATDNRGTFDGLNADITFSVIGPKAKTWDRYKHRAFTGRDDGMQRAEIDASGAKLKAYSYSQDSTVVIPRFRAFIGFVRSSIRQHGRMQAVTDDWTGKQPSIDSYDEVLFIRRALEKIGVKFKRFGELVDSGVLEAVLSPTNANIGAFLRKIEWQPEGMSGYTKLEDVLDYPELYEAYPQLRQVPVLWQKEPKYRGLTAISQTTGDVWVNMNEGLAPERMISTLLHEVQHVVQFIEGYAAGTFDFGELRGWMSDNGYLEQALTMDNRELYSRLAGEIESRNVQMRRDWTMDERLAKPFNETLEYPGEAITVRAENLGTPEARFMGDGGVTFSMASVPLYHKILDTFEQRLSKDNKAVWVSRKSGNNMFTICPYPDVLNAITPWMDNVIANKDVIKKLMNKHHLLPQDVAKLPYALWDPVAVFEDPEADKGFIVITDIFAPNFAPKRKTKKKNKGAQTRQMKQVMAVLELRADTNNAVITEVVSAYSSDSAEKYKALLKNGYLKYADAERALTWATAEGDSVLQLLTTALLHSGSGLILKENMPFVNTNFSASMEKASLQALDVLRTRADEREGERLMNDWQKACEGWAQLHVGGDDSRLGNGAKMLGEIHALIGATKGVLPEKYARMGHLNGLLRWAAVYANMQQTGEVPAEGVIAGPIYEKFVERMRYVDKKNEAYGLNDAEVKEAMALLAGERLDVAMLKVARECKRRLEWFLKDRERERIDWVVERAYPKREKGKRTPRGKMDAEAYRRMERAYRLMAMEANDLAGLMNRIKAALENMETAPADAVEVLRSVRGGDVPGVDEVEALEAELEDELFLAQTFGCWENMAFEQARRASGAMAELVLLGRSAWQSKLRAERRRAAFDREEMGRHFGTKLEDVQAERGDKTAREKGRKRTVAKKIVMGSMSYSQLLLALEPKLGKRFTGRHMRMIAEAHERIMLENQRRHRWMYNTLRDITGLESEGEIEEWMQKNNEVFDTGIDLELPMKSTCRLTPEEAKMWLSLTADEREKKREELMAEATKKGEKPDNVPGEDMIGRLEEAMMEAEQADALPKEFVFTTEWSYKSRLKCTREALLYAILTFEQEDYEHLLEANGLTQAKLQQMRKLVGKKLLSWGYAMRRELSEHGKVVAELYEAYTGVPFGQRQNYFRGVFDVARAKDAGEAVDQVSGVTGGKYCILIARQYHNQQLNWETSASQVFVSTMKEQQNYIATAHIGREWRTLLSDRLFERRVRAEIGDAALDMLNGWLTMIDGAVLADAKVNALMHRLQRRVMGAYAVSRLAGNVYTIMKQGSALLNGFVGGYVPEHVIAGNELVQQLTYRHVGVGEYLAALGKALAGQTDITLEEIEAAGFIEGRKRVEGEHIEEAALLAPGQKVPGKVGRKARALYEGNMDVIGYVDRKANAKAALALAEVVYQQAKKENADGLVPDAELRRVAIETARMMVDRAAQPQLRTQKGYWAAGGGLFGALGNFFYMFKSEVLGKMGLYVAQMFAGQHKAWIGGALSFGVMNSVVLALIDWICGRWYDEDDEKWEKRAKQFAFNVVANDISSVPVIGDAVSDLRTTLLDEWSFRDSRMLDMVVPFGEMWKYGKREWKNVDKGASWDKHVTALCGLARSVGALGGWGLSGHNAAVGSCCELTLAAASLSNTVRFVKDVVKKVVGE